MRRVGRRAAVLAAALACACDSATEPVPVWLEIARGANQVGPTGGALRVPVAVEVKGPGGRLLIAAEVRWRVIEGGGTVEEPVTLSDSGGVATTRWTLGTEPGPQLLLATAGHANVTIRATARVRMRAVTAGYRHTCALSTRNEAFCWGANARGQLGDGTARDTPVPVRVTGSDRFSMLSAGWSHTCAISTLDRTFCWGDDTAGQVTATLEGRPFYTEPTPAAISESLVTVTSGYVHTCGVTADGDLTCWGENEVGQLGGPDPLLVQIEGTGFRQVSAGEFHTCGLASDERLFCWGWNAHGELGTGAPFGAIARVPTEVSGDGRFTAIAAGVRHTCALATDAQVHCWGRSNGEIGQDVGFHTRVPGPVPGAAGFGAVGTGNTHSCGITGEQAYCWGTLLGNGSTGVSRAPVAVAGPLAFTAMSVGFDHSCGVADGEVWCWGSNSHGQIGQPGTSFSAVPVRVTIPGVE